MHTLVIDDDFISLFLTEKLLRQEAFSEKVCAFHSSSEAFCYLQQLPPEQLPQIIFLDLNMPIMSGWDFLAALKPFEQQMLGRCHIYVLTSSLAPRDAARTREFSLVSGLIHKPLDSMEVQNIRLQLGLASPS